MKKLILCVLMALLLASLCGCGQNKLADCFEEASVNAKAKIVAGMVIDRDFEGVCALFREDIAADLTPEYLEELLSPMLDENGEFQKFQAAACAGQKTPEGEDMAISMVVARFEDGKRNFTISFDEEMTLIGLYMK